MFTVSYTMFVISEILFNERIWLVGNATWSALNKYDSEESVPDIALSVPFTFVLLVLRYCVEKFCYASLGRYLSINGTKTKTSPNPLLEQAYLKQKKFERKQIIGWAKQLDWSERQVERWLRLRTRQDKPTTLTKFCESAWRFSYYFLAFNFGLVVLWDKPWLWDIRECWRTYPYQPKSVGIYWYYTVSLACYCSLFLSQFFDIKRKDFWQMFIHHIAAITLLVFSWNARLYRIGSLILLVHDFADIPLEAAKMTKYSGFKKTCEIIFAVFTLCWLLSRMVVFPLWILKSTIFDILDYHSIFPGYYIFNFFLIILFALNIYWTYLLIRLIHRILTAGQIVDDIRSDSASSD